MTKFQYWNENPDGEHIGDCVTRAITLASGLSYEQVQEKLYYCGKLLECDPLCVSCYDFLLTKYFEFDSVDTQGLTLDEFGDKYTRGLFLVRSRGHISCLLDGVVYDTWDCRSMVLTNSWKIF